MLLARLCVLYISWRLWLDARFYVMTEADRQGVLSDCEKKKNKKKKTAR